jgi:dihydroorotate dehydrogenase (NAD+) catalytic subunit
MIDARIQIGHVSFDNPVMVASGTFGYAKEFEGLVDINAIGAIVTKTVTLEPRSGNPPPRIVETPSGMINSIGLPNVGVEQFIIEKMPFLSALTTRLIVNVAGKVGEEFAELVKRLDEVPGIDGYELNYSCPNVKEGGLSFSSDPAIAEKVTRLVRKNTDRLLIAKLTPNVTSIGEIGQAVQNGGADAISAINTLVGMAVDINSRKPKIATITGGLSGPAIKPVALAKVFELVQCVNIPVIAIGGIMTWQDALEFLIVGARAVQVGTANFMDPSAATTILDGLLVYCRENGINRIVDVIGTLKT